MHKTNEHDDKDDDDGDNDDKVRDIHGNTGIDWFATCLHSHGGVRFHAKLKLREYNDKIFASLVSDVDIDEDSNRVSDETVHVQMVWL